MKTVILSLLAVATLSSCYSSREIQVEMVSAQLVRIDTIYRYSETQTKQQLTWRDNLNTQYVSYEPLNRSYNIGTRMALLRTR
jgi:hypothetical protein